MAEFDNDGVDVDREQLMAAIPVEIYSPDEVTDTSFSVRERSAEVERAASFLNEQAARSALLII